MNFIDENKLFLVMPWANNGNLREYLEKKKLNFDEKIQIAIDVTKGIQVLHENNIIHENIVSNDLILNFIYYYGFCNLSSGDIVSSRDWPALPNSEAEL